MTKRFQNHVAESRHTLPLVAVYAFVVWTAAGLFPQQWWVQLACFAVAAFLMLTLNNSYALLRIYSRMVSSAFLVLSCTACFLFDSLRGGIVQLCLIASCLMLFRCYRDKQALGWTYYAFLCIGLASTIFVQTLYFVPLLWLLMVTHLNALSGRTFVVSLFGVLTPYWFAIGWFIFQQDYDTLIGHFTALAEFQPVCDCSQLTLSQLLVFALTIILLTTGMVHFLRNSFKDKIRTRQFYGYFIIMAWASAIFLMLQPQHYDVLMRLIIINTAPVIAHFIALTYTKVTNVAFYVIVAACLLVTGYNLWISSSIF